MQTFTNEQAAVIFNGKIVISNQDGSIWVAEKAEIFSSHQPEFSTTANNWHLLTCKFPVVRGFGQKRVRFTNLQKSEYIREQFSTSFGTACPSDVVYLHSVGIENYTNEKTPTEAGGRISTAY